MVARDDTLLNNDTVRPVRYKLSVPWQGAHRDVRSMHIDRFEQVLGETGRVPRKPSFVHSFTALSYRQVESHSLSLSLSLPVCTPSLLVVVVILRSPSADSHLTLKFQVVSQCARSIPPLVCIDTTECHLAP